MRGIIVCIALLSTSVALAADTIRLEEVVDEDQAAFKITTPAATYYYQKAGAAFSSIVDKDGNDWLNYSTAEGSAGEYRGLPNMGHPDGYMHPGFDKSESRIVSQAPDKVSILSESKDGTWAGRWDIYPHSATMTVLKTSVPFWFLYEGTPGGSCDKGTDKWFLSDGRSGTIEENWDAPEGGITWVAYGDSKLGRSLFIARHEDHGEPASYWFMNENMTVFGFGRPLRSIEKKLTELPMTFTIGLVDASSLEAIKPLAEAAIEKAGD